MEELRRFSVESKTFIFAKEGAYNFRITEKSRRMSLFILLNGSTASWVVNVVGEAIRTRWRGDFFKKQNVGNGMFTIQLLRNSRGHYLLLEEYNNGRRRGSVIIPEGLKGNGWEGFAYNLKKTMEHTVAQPVSRRDGKSVQASKSYAMVVGSEAAFKSAMEGKGKAAGPFPGDTGTSLVRGKTVGEVEGVLWAVKAQLSGVLKEVSLLVQKVDLGLNMVMGLGKETSAPTLSASNSLHVSEKSFPKVGRCGSLNGSRNPVVLEGPEGGLGPDPGPFTSNLYAKPTGPQPLPQQPSSPREPNPLDHTPSSGQRAPNPRAASPSTSPVPLVRATPVKPTLRQADISASPNLSPAPGDPMAAPASSLTQTSPAVPGEPSGDFPASQTPTVSRVPESRFEQQGPEVENNASATLLSSQNLPIGSGDHPCLALASWEAVSEEQLEVQADSNEEEEAGIFSGESRSTLEVGIVKSTFVSTDGVLLKLLMPLPREK
ncbi:hypothetical protein I3842_15G169000 [Carya illinoinensis]|uniref:Uncharacterized protein n=1 Tax=Carya illinoinensis TaxID=32201 RepID=A0A922AFL5_CARIL|nr:hypothetical protein I3842_15G169000 [Carya illinoinensis]